VAALVKKLKQGRPYWYVTETARVNGQPRIVRQRYLGTVESIEAAFDAAFEPLRVEEAEFGASVTMWSLAQAIGLGMAVDVACPKRDQGLSVGTYLQAAAVNRAVRPCSKRAFHAWYARSALARVVPAPEESWSSQRFWDAMDRVPEDAAEAVEQSIVAGAVERFGVGTDALVFDSTNFDTFIDSANARSTLAKRGHAKSGRRDLRLVGLALACSTDHQVPLASALVAGNSPDVRTFEAALPKLVSRLGALGVEPSSISLVFDKGNNSAANLAKVGEAGIGFVGSLVPAQHPELLEVADEQYCPVEGIDGVVAYRSQKEVFGALRTVVVTRSESFLAKQLAGLAQTRARTEEHLAELARLVDGGRHRMGPDELARRADEATEPRWMSQLYNCQVTGTTKEDLGFSWSFDEAAFEELRRRELGKRVIFTDRHSWSTPEIVRAYRSQWEVEAAFRQLKRPDHSAFRPIHHWTDQKVRVHGLYSVAALLLVNLAWRQAERAGLGLSPREVLEALAAIREVTLVYPPAKGKGNPRVLHKLTHMDNDQQALFNLFGLDLFAPREGNTAKWRGF
jgi:transposase